MGGVVGRCACGDSTPTDMGEEAGNEEKNKFVKKTVNRIFTTAANRNYVATQTLPSHSKTCLSVSLFMLYSGAYLIPQTQIRQKSVPFRG